MANESEGRPIGQPFSWVYLRSPAPIFQSERWRVRWGQNLRSAIGEHLTDRQAASAYFKSWAGIADTQFLVGGNVNRFAEELSWTQLLDLSTWVFRFNLQRSKDFDPQLTRVEDRHFLQLALTWRHWLRSSIQDENLAYEVDDECGLHFRVDSTFASMAADAIAGLSSSRYDAARQHLESAIRFMTATTPDTENAVNSAFKAVEVVAKLMAGGIGLNAKLIDGQLLPLVRERYGQDNTARLVADKLMASFKDWVDGTHFYRHGQGNEAHSPPPTELATLLVSGAFGWLRYLLSLDSNNANENAARLA